MWEGQWQKIWKYFNQSLFLSHQATFDKILTTALQSGLIQASCIKFTNGHARFYRKNKVDTIHLFEIIRQTKTDQMHFALYLYSETHSHHWSPLYQRPAGSPESKQTIAHTDSRRLQTLCCVNSFSAVYQGAQPKLFEECFRAKKIPRHFKQHWRDGSSWSRAFKVTKLCKRIQVHTTNTERHFGHRSRTTVAVAPTS